MGEWLDANPLVVYALAILVIVLTIKSLVKNQGGAIIKLIDAIAKNADNVSKLEVLYREQIAPTAQSVFNQEKIQNDMLLILLEIRAMIQSAIEQCKEEEKNNNDRSD